MLVYSLPSEDGKATLLAPTFLQINFKWQDYGYGSDGGRIGEGWGK